MFTRLTGKAVAKQLTRRFKESFDHSGKVFGFMPGESTHHAYEKLRKIIKRK